MKHMKKRVAALLLTLAMVLSLAPMAFAADEFPDMPAEDDPSYAAVKSAVDNAIMTGENGELNLEGTILRSTVAKMVVTAFAAKGEADLSGYPDVMDGAWYASWMAKANQMGIMTGTSGKMNPGNEVTLAEVAAMLCRALGLSVDEDATVEGVAAWAAPYIKALVDAEYITAEDAAKAHEPMTRGAFAEVIYKVSGEGNYAKEENAEITEDVNGNIVITANGVSLKGITVKGDIIIADGVDAGSVVLDGVKVEGRIVVRGAGAELTNGTTASSTVVAATTGEATVKADDGSDAGDIAVAGTNGMAADKVVIDMAEPKVTVTTATEVAVQNAEGGEITLQAANASLSVESGTVGNVTVADGASGVKVDVAEGATIDKVTTNTDLAVTGEGTVTEKAGSGNVTDGSGNEVAGSDEPVEVPTVEEPAPEVDPNAPTNGTHTHNYTVYHQFDATRHTKSCAVLVNDKGQVSNEAAAGYSACGAVIYEEHSFTTACKPNGDVDTETPTNNTTFKCACGAIKPADPTEDITGTTGDGKVDCGNHVWVLDTEQTNSDPTCEDEGVKHYKCTGTKDVEGVATACTATKTVTTPATGHSLTPDVTVAPTCNEAGSITFKCTKCDDFDPETENGVQVIPATNQHVWDNGVITTPATCRTKGEKTYTCTTCTKNHGAAPADTPATETKETPINPTAHEWTIADGKATVAESTNGQNHVITCGNGCGATKTEACTYEAKDGGTAAKDATCEGKGATGDKVCSVCGHEIASTEIPALGHKYSTEWTADGETGHYHACLNGCDNKENGAEAHKWSAYVLGEDGQPTTTPAPDAVCTVCHYKHTATGGSGSGEGGGQETAKHEHKYTPNGNGACSGENAPTGGCKVEHTPHKWAANGTPSAKDASCVECGKPHTCDTTGTNGACSKCGYKAPDQVDGG